MVSLWSTDLAMNWDNPQWKLDPFASPGYTPFPRIWPEKGIMGQQSTSWGQSPLLCGTKFLEPMTCRWSCSI